MISLLKNKLSVLFLAGCLLLGGFMLMPQVSLAQTGDPGVTQLQNPIGGTAENPEGDTNINVLVGRTIQRVLAIIGGLVFAVVIYGGFLFLTSRGKADQVRKAVQTIAYAAIGLFVIFSSYIILNAIINAITNG